MHMVAAWVHTVAAWAHTVAAWARMVAAWVLMVAGGDHQRPHRDGGRHHRHGALGRPHAQGLRRHLQGRHERRRRHQRLGRRPHGAEPDRGSVAASYGYARLTYCALSRRASGCGAGRASYEDMCVVCHRSLWSQYEYRMLLPSGALSSRAKMFRECPPPRRPPPNASCICRALISPASIRS